MAEVPIAINGGFVERQAMPSPAVAQVEQGISTTAAAVAEKGAGVVLAANGAPAQLAGESPVVGMAAGLGVKLANISPDQPVTASPAPEALKTAAEVAEVGVNSTNQQPASQVGTTPAKESPTVEKDTSSKPINLWKTGSAEANARFQQDHERRVAQVAIQQEANGRRFRNDELIPANTFQTVEKIGTRKFDRQIAKLEAASPETGNLDIDQASIEQQQLLQKYPRLQNLTAYIQALGGGDQYTTNVSGALEGGFRIDVTTKSDNKVLGTEEFLGKLSPQEKSTLQSIQRGDLSSQQILEAIERARQTATTPETSRPVERPIMEQTFAETLSEVGRGSLSELKRMGSSILDYAAAAVKTLTSKAVQSTGSAGSIRDGRELASEAQASVAGILQIPMREIPKEEADAATAIAAERLPEPVQDRKEVEPLAEKRRGILSKLAGAIEFLAKGEKLGATQ